VDSGNTTVDSKRDLSKFQTTLPKLDHLGSDPLVFAETHVIGAERDFTRVANMSVGSRR
jgi:hypothetical protein